MYWIITKYLLIAPTSDPAGQTVVRERVAGLNTFRHFLSLVAKTIRARFP